MEGGMGSTHIVEILLSKVDTWSSSLDAGAVDEDMDLIRYEGECAIE
jgi:hypothetical protein